MVQLKLQTMKKIIISLLVLIMGFEFSFVLPGWERSSSLGLPGDNLIFMLF
jgi:hypothetical protein